MHDLLVLCYHGVSPTWPSSLAVTPAALGAQMRRLLVAGYEARPFTEAVSAPPLRHTLAVTFDDGLASVARYALPILRALDIPATVFVPTRAVSDGSPVAWDGVAQWLGTPHEHELVPMSWRRLVELADLGWEVASHTETHPRLTGLSRHGAAEELEHSREVIERHLGSCTSIAYPYGATDDRVAGLAAEAGYEAGAALGRWPGDRGVLRTPRVGIYRRDSLRRFALKTSRVLRAAAALPHVGAQRAPTSVAEPPGHPASQRA